MKMLITLMNRLDYLVQILYSYLYYQCPATGMLNSDEASLSITFGRSSSFDENAHNS